MLEKIFGPSLKFNIKEGSGKIKFADGKIIEIRSFCTEKVSRPTIALEDKFILSAKNKDIAEFLIFRPLYSGKPVYQGHAFLSPLVKDIRDFMPMSHSSIKKIESLGKKLVKILKLQAKLIP